MQLYLWTLAYVTIFNTLILFVSYIVWYHIWVKKLGVEIPIDKKVEGLEKRQLYCTTTSPSIIYDFFKEQIMKFKREYWTRQCGNDAYLYLQFQRKMIRLVVIISIVSLICSFSINLFIAEDQNDWIDRSALNNKRLTPITIWLHSALIITFTILSFYTAFELREEAKDVYKQHQQENSKQKDYEWLKSRTLHVRGLLPKDRRGDMLKLEINKILEEVNGHVLDIVVIPDYQSLFEMEMEKKNLEDLHILSNTHGKPHRCTQCLFQLMWQKGFQSYQKRQEELDQQIDKEIQKPILSSGHAFVVVDSIKSLNHCLQKYKMTPSYAIQIAKISAKENIQSIFNIRNRFRSISQKQTFNKFVDEDIEIAQGVQQEKDLVLIINQAGDPVDIIWSNLGGTRGTYLLRRFIFGIIGILIVLFLSTPTAIYSSLKMLEAFQFLEFGQDDSSLFGKIIKATMPPLVIITLNNILLYMIYYSAYFERRVTHSKYQFSIFNKAYIYLGLNMLIIPAVTMQSHSQSILQVLESNNYNLVQILASFYTSYDSGIFFVSMLIQYGCLSMCSGLLRIGEIIYSCFSPWLAHQKRKYLHDSQPWRRDEALVFSYGYQYSLHLVIISIVFVFSTTVPMISIAGFLFFILKHIIDSFNLLTVNRKEIDSNGKLFQKILLNFQYGILIAQLCMISYFVKEGYISASCLVTIIFLISVPIVFRSNKSIIDLKESVNEEEVVMNQNQFVDVELDDQLNISIFKWRQQYNHPLMVNKERSYSYFNQLYKPKDLVDQLKDFQDDIELTDQNNSQRGSVFEKQQERLSNGQVLEYAKSENNFKQYSQKRSNYGSTHDQTSQSTNQQKY